MITARQLANAYDLSVASIWRGASSETALISWLGEYRVPTDFEEPTRKPDAVSLLGGGGSGIRWYTTPNGVIGCTTGEPHVCYVIPTDASMPQDAREESVPSIVHAEMAGATN